VKGTRLTGWRKIAGAIWDAPADPQIHGSLELDATAMLAFIAAARARGEHVTTTHLVGRAVAQALVAVPELNVRLVGDRAIDRGSVDVFFITAVAGGQDLTGV
jgi:pyruvate/2-oxoglutarate dehydrogenase complex dihydrolipoamide acyltransferase (E2) component